MADNKEWIERIRKQVNPNHSAAADFWDAMKPEWRGVVLHAASITGSVSLGASLTKCSWSELYARVDSRGMAQIRLGIQQARNIFSGFGTLRRDDFTRRTANRQNRAGAPVSAVSAPAIRPQTLSIIKQREQLQNNAGN
ncbi:hypothetical protein ACP51C_002595 [Cronobacter sakazakii]